MTHTPGHQYDPTQPRDPEGTTTGGRWTTDPAKAELVDDILDQTQGNAAERALEFLGATMANAIGDENDEDMTDPENASGEQRRAMKRTLMAELGEFLEQAGITEAQAEAFWEDFSPISTQHGDTPYEHAAQAYMDLWAETSGDSSPQALAIQRVAREQFGLAGRYDLGATSAALSAQVDAVKAKHGPVIKALLASTYDMTQGALEAQGVTEVLLYRGMGELPAGAGIIKTGGKLQFGTAEVQPLSSFSASRKTAEGFMGINKDMITMAARVPREQIFSTCVTGPGCLPETEYIVMAPKTGQPAMPVAYATPLTSFAAGTTWFTDAAAAWKAEKAPNAA